jgi:hypothetical protein
VSLGVACIVLGPGEKNRVWLNCSWPGCVMMGFWSSEIGLGALWCGGSPSLSCGCSCPGCISANISLTQRNKLKMFTP